MNRRQFLINSTYTVAAMSRLPRLSFIEPQQMGIVVHSYGNRWGSKINSTQYPAFQNALDLLRHCHQIGAGGIQIGISNWSADFVKSMRQEHEQLNMYVEGSIAMPKEKTELDKFESDLKNAKSAGISIIRTVSLGGRRYETFKKAADFEEFRQKATIALTWVEPLLKKYQIKLGVENHKDWRATELAAILKKIDSPWIGATLDFGNSIALLENPVEVTQTLAPYVVSTHIKDMAVEEYSDGFLLSEVPLGEGILDLKKIISIVKMHNPKAKFSLEMITRDPLQIPCLTPDYWATFDSIKGKELADTLRMVRQHKTQQPLPRTTSLTDEQRLATEEDNILKCLKYRIE